MLSTVMLALIRPNPSAGQAWLARLGAAMRRRSPTALTPAYTATLCGSPYMRPICALAISRSTAPLCLAWRCEEFSTDCKCVCEEGRKCYLALGELRTESAATCSWNDLFSSAIASSIFLAVAA